MSGNRASAADAFHPAFPPASQGNTAIDLPTSAEPF
jgi:hypothetical protein